MGLEENVLLWSGEGRFWSRCDRSERNATETFARGEMRKTRDLPNRERQSRCRSKREEWERQQRESKWQSIEDHSKLKRQDRRSLRAEQDRLTLFEADSCADRTENTQRLERIRSDRSRRCTSHLPNRSPMHWRIDRENMRQGLRRSTNRVRRKLSRKKERKLSKSRGSCVPPMTTMLRIVTHRKTPEAAEIDRQKTLVCKQLDSLVSYSRVHQTRRRAPGEWTWWSVRQSRESHVVSYRH